MGLFRRRAQVSAAVLQIYMVAGSYWCPALRAGGFRIDPKALGPSPATMADAASKPGAALFPLFPGGSWQIADGGDTRTARADVTSVGDFRVRFAVEL